MVGKKSACQLRQDRLSNPTNYVYLTLFSSCISWPRKKTLSGPYSRSWSKTRNSLDKDKGETLVGSLKKKLSKL